MKKQTLLSLLTLLILCITSCSKRITPDPESSLSSANHNNAALSMSSDYYFYYKGEKRYLDLNTDYAFVLMNNNADARDAALAAFSFGVRKKEQVSGKQISGKKEFYWSEVKLPAVSSGAAYQQHLEQLKKGKGIETVAPYFKSKDSKKIGLSNLFYVKLKTPGDIGQLTTLAEENGAIIISQDQFMPNWFTLSCTGKSKKNALELANLFYETGRFQYAEPDLMVENLLHSGDPFFRNQWNHVNYGQYGATPSIDIDAIDAHNLSKGYGVVVSVIDMGVQLNHPDLSGNISSQSYDTETGSSSVVYYDNYGGNHGTLCAGVIGAVENSIGVVGVAPKSTLMSVSSTLNSATPNIRQKLANGIDWSWQHGADILSNSWGHNTLASSYIDDAITNALTLGRNGKGCVVVFASGNDNSSVIYPANSNPDILAVGAASPCGERKSPSSCDGEYNWGSNYGTELDVVAPGVLIPTTDVTGTGGNNPNTPLHIWAGGSKLSSDYTDRDYTIWFNGTSSACPQVAGVAALMLEKNPQLTGKEVSDIIEKTAKKTGGYTYSTTTGRPNGTWNSDMGYGLVDAHAAVQYVINNGDPNPPLPPAVPIHVYYNSQYDIHDYVIDGSYYSGRPGWTYKGIYFYAYASQVQGTVPVYRFHAYSAIDNQWSRSLSNDYNYWTLLNVPFYAYPSQTGNLIPIHIYKNAQTQKGHFLGANVSYPWPTTNYGVQFYVPQ